jgi:hypothetical protein
VPPRSSRGQHGNGHQHTNDTAQLIPEGEADRVAFYLSALRHHPHPRNPIHKQKIENPDQLIPLVRVTVGGQIESERKQRQVTAEATVKCDSSAVLDRISTNAAVGFAKQTMADQLGVSFEQGEAEEQNEDEA